MSNSLTHTSTIDAIELHVRTYRSALKSTLEVTINSLINTHLKMHSILHPDGDNPNKIDASAFSYALLRLPTKIDKSYKVIMGQNSDIFTQAGFKDINSWSKVKATARRHSTRYSLSKKFLGYFIASISDIDDLTNTLIAYQIEWNKFHKLLKFHYKDYSSLKKDIHSTEFFRKLNLKIIQWENIKKALGKNWQIRFKRIYQTEANLRLQLLASSWINYTKSTQKWWKNIATSISPKLHISHQQIYFVSSNTHSLLNIYTGFALKHQKEILALLKKEHPEIDQKSIDTTDLTYFASKYYFKETKIKALFEEYQQKLGIITIPNSNYLDLPVQIFPVKNLIDSKFLDPRIKIRHHQKIAESKALIFNIDYPLGFAAYQILNEVMENVAKVKGVYILGKAAVLNGEIGDIVIPRLVFDEHTQNSYVFKNCFNSFFPFINNKGSILTNQKSVSVLGTFLENKALINTYSKNNLTIIEMESGPYLTAVSEASYDQQAPKNTIIDLNNAPFDLGIINYTSDTPFSSLQNLGDSELGINGIEAVTLSSLAILQRIINLEEQK
ncbi:MAG: hypothetical protein WCG91_03585 [Candidatus Shapirobacteria bacterium]